MEKMQVAEQIPIGWSEEFKSLSWYDVADKIDELNSGLKDGEKLWRLPTQAELSQMLSTIGSGQDIESYNYGSGRVQDKNPVRFPGGSRTIFIREA